MAPPEDDESIVRYLLDQMAPEERSAFEERLCREPSLVESVSAMEDDLIMRYVCGRLKRRLLQRFEEVYLSSPARRARIESARIVRQTVKDSAVSLPQERRSLFSVGWRIAWLSAAALVALIALLLPLRKKNPTQPIHLPPQNQVIAFSLEPGRVRSGGGAEITVPSNAYEIRLELMWPASTADEKYRVTLGKPEKQRIWSGEAIRRDTNVVTTVPANVLVAGDYNLALQAARGANWHDVAVYYFRVLPPAESGK